MSDAEILLERAIQSNRLLVISLQNAHKTEFSELVATIANETLHTLIVALNHIKTYGKPRDYNTLL